MIQVNNKRSISECFENLIMMSVHVANKKVQHGHVHKVGQTSASVIWWKVAHIFITVIWVSFPSGLSAFMVRSSVRMSIHLQNRYSVQMSINNNPLREGKKNDKPFVVQSIWRAKMLQSCPQSYPDFHKLHERYHSNIHICRESTDCLLQWNVWGETK